MELESGVKIKCIRSDGGGEYISKEFLNYCKINGIHRQFTTPYTPQSNGVAKRKNIIIMGMARNMVYGK